VKKTNSKLISALLVMFLFGGITGAGLGTFFQPYFFSPPSQEKVQKFMQSFLTNRLKLTPEQQEQISPITADFAAQAQTLHTQSVNQFLQLAAATDQRLRQYLTPEQQLELDRLAKERQAIIANHGFPPEP
jgi:hypothetical protein